MWRNHRHGWSIALAQLLLLAIVVPARGVPLGCIWFYGLDAEGKITPFQPSGSPNFPKKHPVKWQEHALHQARMLAEKRPEWERLAQQGNFEARSDLATIKLYEGQYAAAIDDLRKLESARPNQYAIAANLGVAFELVGNVEGALYWVREGIKRNRDSHRGTEWLHVRILEAKQNLADDPEWLKRNTILGLDFGPEPIPRKIHGTVIVGDQSFSADGILAAIDYQLQERLQFVKAPDVIVADLLFDLGSLLMREQSVHAALPVLNLALEYGPSRTELATARRDHCLGLVEQYPDEQRITVGDYAYQTFGRKLAIVAAIAVAVVAGLCVIAFVWWRKRRRQLAMPISS